MNREISERFFVLRDEALNCAELGEQAPGGEIFEAVMAQLTNIDGTDNQLDLSLLDALTRRVAWGESPTTVALDSHSVCRRMVHASRRSFPDPNECTMVLSVITEVACTASRHIARMTSQQAGKERTAERRELMVHRQLTAAIGQQESLLQELARQLQG